MVPMAPDTPAPDRRLPGETGARLATLTRRALVARGAATAAALLGLAACGHDDAAVLGDARAGAPGASDESEPTATTTPAALAGEVTVDFTYEASGGRIHDPYIAVWVEDADGALVDTLAVWFEGGQGIRWLDELRRWYSVDGSQESIDTLSGATRSPGTFSLVWDLTDLDGGPVEAGTYHVCIEAAREHGPYSLIREPVELDGTDTTVALTPDGELTDATVDHVAA